MLESLPASSDSLIETLGLSDTIPGIPNIYKGIEYKPIKDLPTIICVIGASGAGKNSLIDPLIQEGQLTQIITATTRAKREREDDHAYTWMRPRYMDEDPEDYQANLIREYQLVESDAHYGNIYGVPLANLQMATESGGLAVMVTENNGAQTITNNLAGQFNVVTVSVVPDSFAQIADRLKDRMNVAERWTELQERVLSSPEISHFLVHNSEKAPDQTMSGLDYSLASVRMLLTVIREAA